MESRREIERNRNEFEQEYNIEKRWGSLQQGRKQDKTYRGAEAEVRSDISLIKICRLAGDRSRVKRNKKQKEQGTSTGGGGCSRVGVQRHWKRENGGCTGYKGGLRGGREGGGEKVEIVLTRGFVISDVGGI